jgi:leucyl-tRNA synthetase
MSFIKFKKDEVLTVGEHDLDLKLPFGEIEVVQENADFIAMQILIES